MPEEVTQLMQNITRNQKNALIWLETPKTLGAMTISDVLKANTPDEHGTLVKKWAQSIWNSWAQHHQAIKNFTALVVGS